MCKKRGQVTAFIVIGLFLVFFVVLLLYVRNVQQQAEIQRQAGQITRFSATALQVKPYVTECIEKQATIALIVAAKNEGYFEDNVSLPPIDVLEEGISNYVNDNIRLCTSFAVFKEFNVTPGRINISVHLYKEDVVIDVTWPLRLVQQDLVLYEKDFRVTFPLRLRELYDKVKRVVEHNATLDMQYMLSQNINIEIIGCEGSSIKYMVNDKDYLLDENVLRFFFRTGTENLSQLFRFENGIKYVPFTRQGLHRLQLAGENKTISFSVTDNNYVSGCFESSNESRYYTYSVVEGNSIPVSVSSAKPVEIRFAKEQVSDDNLLLATAYTINSPGVNLDNPAVLTFSHNFEYIMPKIYFFDGSWNEIESTVHGDYISADIAEPGKYAVGTSYCAQAHQGKGMNIAFVPVDYENMSEFSKHVNNYTQAFLSVSPMSDYQEKFNIFEIIKPNNLSCLSFQAESCSQFRIKSEAAVCSEQPDYFVALIDNSIIGLDHKTEQNVSYIGSYVTLNPEFCSTCNFIREFGHFMGLADEFAYLGNASANQTSTYPNCDNEFSGEESVPCPKWANISGTGCYGGCVYENWYRPSKGFVIVGAATNETINVSHSIMRGDFIDGQKLRITNIYFDPVSENYLREQIEKWN
jgi:hypothetical protein